MTSSTTHVSASVVIITCNRCDMLKNTLQSLENQGRHDFEVITVVDGSQDGTASFLQHFSSSNFSLRFIIQENQGKSFSRNKGASMATTNLLIFVDDDMVLFPACIGQHIQHHDRVKKSICVGTQEDDPAVIVSDFDLFRYTIGRIWESNIIHPSTIIPDKLAYITAANFSIATIDFRKLKGFDPLTDGAEDLDLAARAIRNGITIYYNSAARAMHDLTLNCQEYVAKQIDYNRSKIKMKTLKPEYSAEFFATAEYVPSHFKRMIYSLISWPRVIRWIDQGWLSYFVPRAIRFKFYDLAITGIVKVHPERF